MWFEGISQGATIDLTLGLNLVSLPALKEDPQLSSYAMLEELGDETEVSHIQRYDSTEGWQTTSWFLGVPSGSEFETRKGEGYVFYMNQEKPNWFPY